MADAPRQTWITGVGIVSCLGEGADAHWQGLSERRLNVDSETFAPYLVHPLAPLNLDLQIPKKGDQRQPPCPPAEPECERAGDNCSKPAALGERPTPIGYSADQRAEHKTSQNTGKIERH